MTCRATSKYVYRSVSAILRSDTSQGSESSPRHVIKYLLIYSGIENPSTWLIKYNYPSINMALLKITHQERKITRASHHVTRHGISENLVHPKYINPSTKARYRSPGTEAPVQKPRYRSPGTEARHKNPGTEAPVHTYSASFLSFEKKW